VLYLLSYAGDILFQRLTGMLNKRYLALC